MRIFETLVIAGYLLSYCGSSQVSTEHGNDALADKKIEEIDSTKEEKRVYPDNVDSSQHAQVLAFIELVEQNKLDELSSMIEYPLKRESPLADITTAVEFVDYPYELFDEEIKTQLQKYLDEPDIIDRTMSNGKFGILNGLIWFWDGGSVAALNYTSKKEQDYIKLRDVEIRALLHPSVQSFEKNYYIGQTEKFTFRIDWLDDTYENLRYASWSNKWNMSQQPDIIIENGIMEKQGTIGGYTTSFENGEYSYVLDQRWAAENDSGLGDFLLVMKNGKEISSARVTEILDELAFLKKG